MIRRVILSHISFVKMIKEILSKMISILFHLTQLISLTPHWMS
jgi:hypothetical protein